MPRNSAKSGKNNLDLRGEKNYYCYLYFTEIATNDNDKGGMSRYNG
jgi:hypothetical protein